MMRGHMARTRLCQLILTVIVMSLKGQVFGGYLFGKGITDNLEENDGNHTNPASPLTNSSLTDVMEEDRNHTGIPMNKGITTGEATTVCGGEFKSTRGVLRHPMSGDTYQNNEECIWIIRASNPINIKFVNFNTESKLDYLYVRDGESNTSHVHSFSGDNVPSSVKTSTNVAHLRFTSDGTITNSGFELHWQSIGCGGEYSSSTGVIRHPLSGDNYHDNERCAWIIRAEDRIKISFVTFDTYNSYDYLTIWDGESNGSHVLGNFSGDNIPPSVTTSTNVAYLHFTSDGSITNTGFELHWQSIGCGGEYNSSTGVIRHPLSGGNYHDNERCTWIIRTEDRIKISFVTFDTYNSYDYLTIRDGKSNVSQVLGNFSGDNIPPSVMTSTHVAYLHFTSDGSITNTGFELHWQSTGCGGEYTSKSGTIRHPLSGGNYHENENCIWVIKAEDRINITFVTFDTYDSYDSLTIRDGESNDSNVLGKFYGSRFSGTNVPKSVQTRTNAAHLLFTSDAAGSRTGFELHWEPIRCGGELNSNSGIIRHPFNGNYQNNEDCIWIIMAPSPFPITITFVRFNIERKLDHLYVRDGKTCESPVVGNFTGDIIPPSIKTTRNMAHVHFTSDDSITKNGFEIHWQNAGCIGNFFKLRGSEQCFKLFADRKRNWDDAKTKCVSEGLHLAEPSDAVADSLRRYLVDVYGPLYGNNVESWLGARGNGYMYYWQRRRAYLYSNSPLWDEGPGSGPVSTAKCLELDAYLRSGKPYDSRSCTTPKYTVCEAISE